MSRKFSRLPHAYKHWIYACINWSILCHKITKGPYIVLLQFYQHKRYIYNKMGFGQKGDFFRFDFIDRNCKRTYCPSNKTSCAVVQQDVGKMIKSDYLTKY